MVIGELARFNGEAGELRDVFKKSTFVLGIANFGGLKTAIALNDHIEIMESKRALIKSSLRPPERKAKVFSYTQPPASKDEISVRKNMDKAIPGREGTDSVQNKALQVTDACI